MSIQSRALRARRHRQDAARGRVGQARVHARDTGRVLHRDRAAHAAAPRETGRLDAELRQIARARLPVIDEFGYMPIDRTVRHGRLTGFGGRLLPQRARPHDQIAGKKRAAGSDGAVSVGNQPPTLLKRSAHTVDTNLQKHNPHAPSRDARSSSSRWSGERPASCIALISGSGRCWPVSRLPSCEYRHRGVDRAMSYSALISRDGLPLSHDCTICRLNASS